MNSKLKPGLMAGGALGVFFVITGLLAAIPFAPVRMVGCCNCLWPIVGGALAAFLYIKNSTTPASVGDGAIVGAIAGAIGGLFYLFIALPISYFLNGIDAMDAQVRQINPDFPLSGIVLLIFGGVVAFVIFIILSTVGGLIGVPIFEKRKGTVTTPPPPVM